MRRKINICILLIILAPLGIELVLCQQDQITITTYFPAPFANYRWLRAVQKVVVGPRGWPIANGTILWGDAYSRGELSSDQGASIELGGTGGAGAVSPYINFDNDTAAWPGYKSRIQLNQTVTLQFLVRGGTYDWSPSTPAAVGRAALSIVESNPGATHFWGNLYVKCVKYHWGWIPVDPLIPQNGQVCRADLDYL